MVGWGIVKAHDGRGDTDATLLLYLHPVGGSRLADLVRLDCSGYVDSTSVEQEFLGQGRLTGIRVRDDRKCPATKYLLLIGVG